MSLFDGLIDCWAFAEAAGVVAIGSRAARELDLGRGRYDNGNELAAPDGWTTEPGTGRNTYNGGGQLDLGAPLPFAEGDAFTLGVRFWAQGGMLHGMPPSEAWVWQLIMGARGAHRTGFSSGVETGTWVEIYDTTPGDPEELGLGPALPVSLFVRQTGQPLALVPMLGPVDSVGNAIFCLIAVFRRVSGQIRVQGFLNGVELTTGDGVTAWSSSDIDTQLFAWGNDHQSHGAITQAAIWSRAVTPEEAAELGSSLDALFADDEEVEAGPGTENPLLTPAGESALRVGHLASLRTDLPEGLGAVLASDGPRGRQTRRAHECTPRRYVLSLSDMTGDEVALVCEAIAVTRGGASTTRWRHPADDPPGTPATAPKWRIIPPIPSITRSTAGSVGATTLTLEEV